MQTLVVASLLTSEDYSADCGRFQSLGFAVKCILPFQILMLPCCAGVGWATSKRLKTLGVVSISDLRQFPRSQLEEELGVTVATTIRQLSFGVDHSSVVAYSRPQVCDQFCFLWPRIGWKKCQVWNWKLLLWIDTFSGPQVCGQFCFILTSHWPKKVSGCVKFKSALVNRVLTC